MPREIAEIARDIASRFPSRVNPPLTAEDEAALTGRGLPIADEVLTLLRVFDGERPAVDSIFPHIRLLSSGGEVGIAWHLQVLLEGRRESALPVEFDTSGWSDAVRKVHFSRHWTPFISVENGDVWFVDHDPAESGTDGQIVLMNVGQGGDVVEVVAPSLRDLLDKLATNLSCEHKA